MPLVLHSGKVKAQMLYKLSIPTKFEAQPHFQTIAFMTREAEKEELNIFQNAVNSAPTCKTATVLQNVWSAVTKTFLLGTLQVLVEPYV